MYEERGKYMGGEEKGGDGQFLPSCSRLGINVFRSPFSSTIRVREGLDGSRRYSLVMQIVYTQKYNI